MIISSILLLLLSNAVILRRDKSILYSRISMTILIYSCLIVIKQIFFEKPSYKLNPVLNDLSLNCVISNGKTILKKTMLKVNNIVISSSLSVIISILTLIILLFIFIILLFIFMILLFIFIPQEWLSMSNILALKLLLCQH